MLKLNLMEDDKKTLKVKCFITGEESIFSGDYLKTLTEKYFSRENLAKYYITYKAKSLLFKGYSIPEIRKILVLKQISLDEPDSIQGNELIKFWQDQKSKNSKFKTKDSDKVSFVKTDDDVKLFLDKWTSYKNLEEI